MSSGFDMSIVQRGARLKRTPYFEATQRYGARGYSVYNHMLFPINFDDLEAEYWKLGDDVTVWDVGVEHDGDATYSEYVLVSRLFVGEPLMGVAQVGGGHHQVLE